MSQQTVSCHHRISFGRRCQIDVSTILIEEDLAADRCHDIIHFDRLDAVEHVVFSSNKSAEFDLVFIEPGKVSNVNVVDCFCVGDPEANTIAH